MGNGVWMGAGVGGFGVDVGGTTGMAVGRGVTAATEMGVGTDVACAAAEGG